MANPTMNALCSTDNPSREASHRLYHAYRHAKACWDAQLYAPERFSDDLPEEVNDPLSDAHSQALDAYMLAPAGTPSQLARKLSVFRDEDLKDWHRASEFVSVLAADADRLSRAKGVS